MDNFSENQEYQSKWLYKQLNINIQDLFLLCLPFISLF